MSWLGHSRRFFTSVRDWMPVVLEASITIASVRMAILLFKDQGYFEKYHEFYAWLLAHFPTHEWEWGILAATAAGLKGLGIGVTLIRRSERAQELAFVMRSCGWALSVIFWTTFTLSIQFGDPWSLGAISCTAMAMLSVAALVMGPAMPEAPYVYEG